AGAVRAGDKQPFTGGEHEAQVLEQDLAAALAADVEGGKTDAFGHLLRFCANQELAIGYQVSYGGGTILFGVNYNISGGKPAPHRRPTTEPRRCRAAIR